MALVKHSFFIYNQGMTDIKVGQIRRINTTEEIILITSIDTIAILHGYETLVTYLVRGDLQSSEHTWVIFNTELISENR